MSNQPSKNELKEIENLFNSNEIDILEKKTRKLIDKYPKISVLYNILGIVLKKKNNPDEAILNLNKAIDLQPNFDQAHNNLGNILKETGRIEEAINAYRKTLKINPNYAEAYSNLGNALTEVGKIEEAIVNHQKALKLNPSHAVFYTNLGTSLVELGKYEEAILNHRQALKLNPQFAEAYSNLGNALTEVGKIEEAIVNHQKALKLNPKYKMANFNESIARLTLGEFEIGWEKYETRIGKNNITEMRYPIEKIWDGNYLNGVLLVWAEQGLGDHIIFASMLTDLSKYAKKIILQIDERLENLLTRYFAKIHFLNIKIVKSEKELVYDKHIAIGSLGQYLRKSKKFFKTTPKKFLITSASKENKLKKEFFNNSKFKVGISWRTLNKKQKFRNIDLEQMIPILSNTNCDFINLQFGKFDDDLKNIKQKYGVNIRSINEIDNLKNIDSLAALINCLDLVITIQNTTAHLSGALGKNTWVMLTFNARWHWLKNENRSLWYPTIKLFRQKKIGNWVDVINNISIDLKSLSQHT